MNSKILNLTPYNATAEQRAEGVTCGDVTDEQQAEMRQLFLFDQMPTLAEIRERAQSIAAWAAKTTTLVDYGEDSGLCVNEPLSFAMIGGPPFLMGALAEELRKIGITPLYSFMTNELDMETFPDGSVRRRGCWFWSVCTESAVYRHRGFIPAV